MKANQKQAILIVIDTHASILATMQALGADNSSGLQALASVRKCVADMPSDDGQETDEKSEDRVMCHVSDKYYGVKELSAELEGMGLTISKP